MLPLPLVKDTVLELLQQHLHQLVLSIRTCNTQAVLICEQHSFNHLFGFFLCSYALHLHQMVDEAALCLVDLEMLLEDLSSLLHVIVRPSHEECLSHGEAKELKLAINLVELIE